MPSDSGYLQGQAIIGHLHFLDENKDACAPFDATFASEIAPIERDPLDHEDASAMVQDFVLIDRRGGCNFAMKLKNLRDAGVEHPIFADSTMWQVSSQ